jgi:hypothetical protein
MEVEEEEEIAEMDYTLLVNGELDLKRVVEVRRATFRSTKVCERLGSWSEQTSAWTDSHYMNYRSIRRRSSISSSRKTTRRSPSTPLSDKSRMRNTGMPRSCKLHSFRKLDSRVGKNTRKVAMD